MAETTKRKFYNTGNAKGFTKAKFFETVRALASGEEVDDDLVTLVAQAAEYEIEGITNKTTTPSGDKKNPLDSDYAVALRAAITPLIGKTPQTAEELVKAATARGSLSPKGTEWAKPWVGRVLNALVENGELTKAAKVVTVTDSKGLSQQKELTAYTK